MFVPKIREFRKLCQTELNPFQTSVASILNGSFLSQVRNLQVQFKGKKKTLTMQLLQQKKHLKIGEHCPHMKEQDTCTALQDMFRNT